MKNVMNLVLTFIFATQFNLAKAAEMDAIAQVSDIVDEVHSMDTVKYKKHSKKFLGLIDQAIEKASKSEESFESLKSKLTKNMDELFQGRKKRTEKLLKNKRHLARLHKKLSDQNLTLSDFKDDLARSIQPDTEQEIKKSVFSKLKDNNSVVEFLKDFRQEVEQDSNVAFQKPGQAKQITRMPASYNASAWIVTVLFIALLVAFGIVVIAMAVIALSALYWVWVIMGIIALYFLIAGVVKVLVSDVNVTRPVKECLGLEGERGQLLGSLQLVPV